MNVQTQITANIRAHNRVARKFEREHGEIYNAIEQDRLVASLTWGLSQVRTIEGRKTALDFGSGPGNLTRKLSALGCDVFSCDVSPGFLEVLASRDYPTNVRTVRINGTDLSPIEDASVDMVATYAVMHHVPDYLGILNEFVRVLKPGGVIYIDHEQSAEVWAKTPQRMAFLAEMNAKIGYNWRKYFRWQNYWQGFMRRFVDSRYLYLPEADIHVHDHDHIEWDKIGATLVSSGAEILEEQDYLLFCRHYDKTVYDKHKDKTTDMHVLIARKP